LRGECTHTAARGDGASNCDIAVPPEVVVPYFVIGAKNRIAGVSMRATDADWQHGQGPEVTGRTLRTLSGRTANPRATMTGGN